MERKKFFGSSERYKLEILSLYNKFPDLKYQFDLIINKVCSGLRIPKPILLSAGETTNRAVLDSLIDFNQFEISLVQQKISQIIEEQIFEPICRANKLNMIPDLHWYSLVTEDERQKAEIRHLDIDSILNLYRAELIPKEVAESRVNNLFEGKLKM